MIEHEYGGSPFFFFQRGDDPLSFIRAHLRVLFGNAVQQSRRSRGRIFLDNILSILPKGTSSRLIDERNSVGIALGHARIARVSALETQLRSAVDTIGNETEFGFSAKEIEHVCVADSMAALVFTASRSGYVREAGLAHIEGFGPEIGLSLVILRLNDWVPEVRAAALRTIERLKKNDGGPNGGLAMQAAISIGLLLDERRFNRMSEKERRAAKSLIEYPGVDAAVHWLFVHCETNGSVTYSLQAALQTGYCDDKVPEIAMKSKCSHRRLIAVRAMLEGRYVWMREGLSHTREICLETHRQEIVRNALLDKSANVAFVALGYLIKSDEVNSLDNDTVSHFLKRTEPSLQRRIGIVRDMIGERN